MDSARWQQVKEVLHTALELKSDQRSHYLGQVCSADPDLRAEVESLLEAHDEAASGFMEVLPISQGPRLQAGTRVGAYKILSMIGTGGMGEVYRAFDPRLGREVAIKTLSGQATPEAGRLRRFEQEARAAAMLNHPNIAAIFDIGNHEGSPFIVAELLEGASLNDCLRLGRLSIDKVLDYSRQISAGLAAAHARGILHRDLKPENIFITSDGKAKILDFGLAKLTDVQAVKFGESPIEKVETALGTLAGTVGYMAPEQLRGQAVDHRCDIFALGAVFYEMLTNKKAFAGATPADTVSSTLHREPPDLAALSRDVPPTLFRLVCHCLEKECDRRFQSVQELCWALEVVQEEYRQGLPAPSIPAHRGKTRSRILAGAAFVAMAAGVVIAVYVPRSQPLNSLAVIPFKNSTADPNGEYLSDGITEGVIDDLSRSPQLSVMARSTVFHYAGTTDPLQVGRTLHVRAVLTGRLLKQQDMLTLQTELVDVDNGTRIWGAQYVRKFAAIASLQDEIAKDISRQLKLRLSGDHSTRLSTQVTPDREAYQLYLVGLHHLRRAQFGNSAQENHKAVDAFTQAMNSDPGYAPPYAELAATVLVFSQELGLSAKDAAAKAREAALKALQIDHASAAAHIVLGKIKRDFDWDWSGAASEFEHAIELNPNSSDAHASYALLLAAQSQFQAAIKEAKRANDLDLMNLSVSTNLVTIYMLARQYELAIQQCRKILEIEPALLIGHTFCGTVYFYQGQYAKAFDEWQQMADPTDPREVAALKKAAADNSKFGYREGLRSVIKYLESSPGFRHPADLAALYASMGESDKAFEYLEKAYNERDAELVTLKTFPGYDSLRSDPRYKTLLYRMGMAP